MRLAILILFFVLCLSKSLKAEEGRFITIPSDLRKEAYVVPASNPVKDADLDSYYPHHHRWTPTASQCSEADLAIKQWVDDEFRGERLSRTYRSKGSQTGEETAIEMIHRCYSEYSCQFIGIAANGEKLIFANYYLFEDGSHEGAKNFIFIEDGGPLSWQIQYDMNHKTCSLVLIASYYR